MWQRLMAWLATHFQYSVHETIDLEAERRKLDGERLPTFDDCYGCLDCGTIQPRPDGYRCRLCNQEHITNLVLQLQRGAKRIEKKRTQLRRVT